MNRIVAMLRWLGGIDRERLRRRYWLLAISINGAFIAPFTAALLLQGPDASMGWYYAFFVAVLACSQLGYVVAARAQLRADT